MAVKDKNRRTPILGRAAIADKEGVFSSDLAKIEVKAQHKVLREYLYYFFKNETYIQEIKRFSAGSTMKSISPKDMAAIQIPLPPLSIQREVIQEIKRYEQMMLAQQEAAHFFQKKCHERKGTLGVM